MAIKLIAFVVIVAAISIAYFCPCIHKDVEIPVLKDGWWGKIPTDGKIPADDPSLRSFTVPYKESDVKDLHERLLRVRLSEPLQNVQFQYGFNTNYLKEILTYWRTKYDWKKQVTELNKFEQYITQIEGISVHYIHVKPKITNKKIRILPLMLIHGWPGSVVEFYKIIPLLTTPKKEKDYVFEVICPSIPGYGFSEAPHQTGFNMFDAARVFNKLMDRLKHKSYYVQGGDWGSAIATAMSAIYPNRITGVHLNMILGDFNCKTIFKMLVTMINPNWVMNTEDQKLSLPFLDKLMLLLRETGYMHIQATKPDTVGVGLSDSPAGLAAYILEKFSTWTHSDNVDIADGALTKKHNLDDMLNNVMVYWVTNSITSSVRFYKENVSEKVMNMKLSKLPVHVPAAIAIFPNDLYNSPRIMIEGQFRNITQYTHMPRGGHFSAMEEPVLLSEDIWKFAGIIQKS